MRSLSLCQFAFSGHWEPGISFKHATDGSSNMQGYCKVYSTLMYKEFKNKIWIKYESCSQPSVTTQSVTKSESLKEICTAEWHYCVGVWESESQDQGHRCFSSLGERQWYAKDATSGNCSDLLLIKVIVCMWIYTKLRFLHLRNFSQVKSYPPRP